MNEEARKKVIAHCDELLRLTTLEGSSFSMNPAKDAEIKAAIQLWLQTWFVKEIKGILDEVETGQEAFGRKLASVVDCQKDGLIELMSTLMTDEQLKMVAR